MRVLAPVLVVLAGLCAPALAQSGNPVSQGAPNVPQFEPAFPQQTRAPSQTSGVTLAQETVADGLAHPWGIAVLPQGGYLVTERPGRLRHVAADGTVSDPIEGLPGVVDAGQGGLLDVALSEDFPTSRVVFLTYAKPMGGGRTATAAARAVLSEDLAGLTQVEDIFVQDPPADNAMHFGSRIVPDGRYVYITTGEHFTDTYRQYAQDRARTYGKIVRLFADGSVPSDNPFTGGAGASDQVWTLGHRNVQGAAIRPRTGDLWALEHGPAGGDELNRIERGANYGWPVVSYGRNYQGSLVGSGEPRADGFTEPRYYWDPVIAPGGFAFYEGPLIGAWQGDVLAASLNPGGLVRLDMQGDRMVGEERFLEGLRLRDVQIDADGSILVLEDAPAPEGRILRLTPER